MNVTQEMRQALQRGQPVEITDSDTREVYVVLKREQYQALQRLVVAEEFDPSLFEVEEIELDEKT